MGVDVGSSKILDDAPFRTRGGTRSAGEGLTTGEWITCTVGPDRSQDDSWVPLYSSTSTP